MLGKSPPAMQGNGGAQGGHGNDWQVNSGTGRADLSVEERINELASALGMPSKDLASAIAIAVREYVPPASLSSVSAHQTGRVNLLCIVTKDGWADQVVALSGKQLVT